jgi:hypothetical protein
MDLMLSGVGGIAAGLVVLAVLVFMVQSCPGLGLSPTRALGSLGISWLGLVQALAWNQARADPALPNSA